MLRALREVVCEGEGSLVEVVERVRARVRTRSEAVVWTDGLHVEQVVEATRRLRSVGLGTEVWVVVPEGEVAPEVALELAAAGEVVWDDAEGEGEVRGPSGPAALAAASAERAARVAAVVRGVEAAGGRARRVSAGAEFEAAALERLGRA